MSFYADDGSWNITVVDGTDLTGIQADDGSTNITQDAAVTSGYNHPCGAVRVTDVTDDVGTRIADDGSLNITTSGVPQEAQKVTVVSGALA